MPDRTCPSCGLPCTGRQCWLCSNRRKLQTVNKVTEHQFTSGIASQHSRGRRTWVDMDEYDRHDLASRYIAGDSLTTLGVRFGVTGECIRNWLKRLKVRMRPKGKIPDWTWRVAVTHQAADSRQRSAKTSGASETLTSPGASAAFVSDLVI